MNLKDNYFQIFKPVYVDIENFEISNMIIFRTKLIKFVPLCFAKVWYRCNNEKVYNVVFAHLVIIYLC